MVNCGSAVILQEKKVLLLKRTTSPYENYWVFPGGRAFDTETPIQAVIREVKEESNLQFIPYSLVSLTQYEDRHLYRYIGHWFGKISLSTEHSDFCWATYEQAKKMPLGFDYEHIVDLLRERGLL
jgi:8-oxo-dGTP diphosphatase